MITQQEYDSIFKECKNLPPAKGDYLVNDYIENIFATVLDFMLKGQTLEKAGAYYEDNRWNEIRTHDDLKKLLSLYPDNKEGNTALALYLWNHKYWTRVSLMRKLVSFFESVGITSQETLMKWANNSNFEDDFKGKISGMGYAIFQWLVMRQGIETIKPDRHVRRFVESIIHRSDVTDEDLVVSLEQVATELRLKAYELDWRIWEYQKSK
jgi:hypothetical protein